MNSFKYKPARHKYLFDMNEDIALKYEQFTCVFCGLNAIYDPRVNWFWGKDGLEESQNDEFCLKTKDKG